MAEDTHELVVTIAATFTAELVEAPLSAWLAELGYRHRIVFAPFSQVFPQLLDDKSVLAQNRAGMGVLLIRVEDWLRAPADPAEVERNLADLVRLVGARAEAGATLLLCFCPPPPGADLERRRVEEARVAAELGRHASVQVVTSAELLATYPVDEPHDENADQVAHIPYTMPLFVALATLVARRLDAWRRPPYKVLALDCDQTLWHGVVGEDGPAGVALLPAHRALQELALAQARQGMLLCLVSKNREEDVREVLRRPDMILHEEHIAGWRVDWSPKSENLRALAAELRLGLDAFVFLDDNPVECAEVGAHCPEVLTLSPPTDEAGMRRFLRSCWAFDRWTVTAEDRQRTLTTRQEREREALRSAAPTFEEFLAGLELTVTIEEMKDTDLARVAQLTLRTNQFNLTTLRRSESELRVLIAGGARVLVVRVADRFGDYGLVGALIYTLGESELVVDTFLLSCRALQRGVEHRMLAELGERARAAGAKTVGLRLVATPKNRPAQDFLGDVAPHAVEKTADGLALVLPAGEAARAVFRPRAATSAADATSAATSGATSAAPSPSGAPLSAAALAPRLALHRRTATELADASAIERFLTSRATPVRARTAAGLPPRDLWEQELATLWEELLGISGLGVTDDLFVDLGASSLTAARASAELRRRFDRVIDPTVMIGENTVEKQAAILRSGDDRFRGELVALKPHGTKRPLYLLPGAGGSAFQYASLARRFDRDRPLFAFQDPNLFADAAPHASTEALAERYLTILRRTQPHGPYLLGGWSYGGALAFEMANRLEQAGETVSAVILFDTPKLAWTGRARRRLERRLRSSVMLFASRYPSLAKSLLGRMLGIANLEELSPYSRFFGMAWLGGDQGGDVQMVEFAFPGLFQTEELRGLNETALWEHVFERVKELDPKYVVPGADASATRRAARVWGQHHELQDRYSPKWRYSGRLTIFAIRGNKEPLGWRERTLQPLELQEFDIRGTERIPHAHNALMDPENVALFIEALNRTLDQAVPDEAAAPPRAAQSSGPLKSSGT